MEVKLAPESRLLDGEFRRLSGTSSTSVIQDSIS
jgi:hypothetical protein